jgi:DNA primase
MGSIDDVKERTDIVELINSSGVSLRKTGRSYVGFCPFHSNTRTPAFNVYPDSQSFYCFGCHASGTVFDYVMRKQGVDFREALEELARRAGVQLAERSDEERQLDARRTRLLEICAAAAKYFNYVLLSLARAQPGRDYVAKRELSPETVESFQLGYSLDDWGHLFHYLTEKKNYAPEEIEAAGLAVRGDTRGYYDRFRGRLIFPIRNGRGEVVGFGGRALGDGQPKYLNTPETLLYKKGDLLYGLDLAREAIRSADATVVVEGYVDVLTAHQHGFRNVVAPLGTALTKNHVAMLKKLSHNVFMALDQDAAGQKATLRGLDALQEQGSESNDGRVTVSAEGAVRLESDLNLRIIRMPEGRDPDEVIKGDPELWRKLIAEAAPVMDFYIDAYTAGVDLSHPQGQSAALERLVPLLAALDGARQRAYIARVEQVVGIKAELILDLVRGTRKQGDRGTRGQGDRRQGTGDRGQRAGHRPNLQSPVARPQPHNSREEHLLALLLYHPQVGSIVESMLFHDLSKFPDVAPIFGSNIESLFQEPENVAILRYWLTLMPEEKPTVPELQQWANTLEVALRDQALRLVNITFPKEYLFRREAERYAKQIRIDQIRKRQLQITSQANEAIHYDEEEYQRLKTLSASILEYQIMLNSPRRITTYLDSRDTLGKE